QQADAPLILNHSPIAARVDPFFVRVHGDGKTAGANITAAVIDVPNRRRKFKNVDISAPQRVLENRTVLDNNRRKVLGRLLIMIETSLAQLLFGKPLGKCKRQRAPLAGKTVDQQAKALWAAGHFVE